MVLKTQAFYFDGLTSAPHNVELTLDTSLKDLSFTNSGGNTVSSNISDIKYETCNDRMEISFKGMEMPVFVENREFIDEAKSLFGSKAGIYQELINLKLETFLLITPIVILLIIAVYVIATPFVAKAAVTLIPVTVDVRLGKLFLDKFAGETRVDSAKTALLNEFASHISWGNNIELNFHVVQSGMVNALALPSGDIIVFTGLLNKLDDYETLAALLGHEITHINNRHSMQSLCKGLIGYALITVLTTDFSGLATLIIDNVNRLNNLSYSQTMERDADDGGLILLEKNGIHPAGMLKLMNVLQSAGKGDEIPDIISTHPGVEKRIRHIKPKVPEKTYGPRPELERLFEDLQDNR
ncbi:MAG: M48 family metallopeptidase [Chitinispirillia bacterium]|nr:M48 family metallopeptidase [Chitinispirillia bacterium]MCL2241981.1 M48 family metallopeptidase [Chitinispirillia bacterium]